MLVQLFGRISCLIGKSLIFTDLCNTYTVYMPCCCFAWQAPLQVLSGNG